MFWLLAEHKHFRGPLAQITDPIELAIGKDKLLLLAQPKSIPLEFTQLQSGIPVKKPIRIAGYSQFIAPGGIIQSTERIQRLAEIS